jgi:hypothetical protein
VIGIPLFTHWNEGSDPPLTGEAEKVTLEPEHTGFADAAMETATVNKGLTTMLTVFEVTGFSTGQIAFEVKTQLTASLLTGE